MTGRALRLLNRNPPRWIIFFNVSRGTRGACVDISPLFFLVSFSIFYKEEKKLTCLKKKKHFLFSSPGGENGFNQAIELSADALANVKFVQEKRLISKFFDEISQDTGKFVFGVADTLACLEMGAVETLIVWESLDVNRYTLMNTVTGATETKVREKGRGGEGREREVEREREREREKE